MIKEFKIELSEEEINSIKEIMNFGVMYGAYDPYHDKFKDGYLMCDNSVMSCEEVEEKLNTIKPFKKRYLIDDNVVFELNVDINEETITDYIINSLYTKDGNLLIHNTSKYELDDLFRGFGFSTMENIHNDNEIFEITELGKEILSSKAYVVKFEINQIK